MNKPKTETKNFFKEELIQNMDRLQSVSISTGEEPVIFSFLGEMGFMIEGKTFIDFTFKDPDKTKDRLISYMPEKLVIIRNAEAGDRYE